MQKCRWDRNHRSACAPHANEFAFVQTGLDSSFFFSVSEPLKKIGYLIMFEYVYIHICIIIILFLFYFFCGKLHINYTAEDSSVTDQIEGVNRWSSV